MSKIQMNHEHRLLKLPGTYNVRDLGGYPTKDGKRTKIGKYYRADSIHALPVESRKILLNQQIGLIVDLRYSHEGTYDYHKDLGLQYANIGLLDPAVLRHERPKSLSELYCNIIDSKQDQLQQVYHHFAAAKLDQARLFHCRVGKDRTGIVAALLLDLAGVSHDIIIEDYSLSADYLKPLYEERRKRNQKLVPMLMESNPETMEQFLGHLYKKYDNAEGYLYHIGLSIAEIDHLKRSLID